MTNKAPVHVSDSVPAARLCTRCFVRNFKFLVLLGTIAISTEALASYEMFCKLTGKVISEPIGSEIIRFDFLVEEALDIRLKDVGWGNRDCHTLEGRTINVVLDVKDSSRYKEILKGAEINIERYDIDVVDNETGEIFRSVKYVRSDT
ncbi:MAG: hypothetical protein AAF485_30525 [Chloroflexota bacterium]